MTAANNSEISAACPMKAHRPERNLGKVNLVRLGEALLDAFRVGCDFPCAWGKTGQ